jgi:hypothetical protein
MALLFTILDLFDNVFLRLLDTDLHHLREVGNAAIMPLLGMV